jgi:hypothetical protein
LIYLFLLIYFRIFSWVYEQLQLILGKKRGKRISTVHLKLPSTMVDGYAMCVVAVVASGITLVGMGQYVAVPVIHPRRRRRRRHNNFHHVRLAYQSPSSSTFLSEQISHQ